jgi:hypothetical protein
LILGEGEGCLLVSGLGNDAKGMVTTDIYVLNLLN